MAATYSAAPAERMAVLEARLLPGSESTMAVAVLFGSLAGGAASKRADEVEKWVVVMAGNVVRRGRLGRARTAPVEGQSLLLVVSEKVCILNAPLANREAMLSVLCWWETWW